MPLLNRFDPPAFLPDFNAIPEQLDAWNQAVSNWFDFAIETSSKKIGGDPIQFCHPAKTDPGDGIDGLSGLQNSLLAFGRPCLCKGAERLPHFSGGLRSLLVAC